MDQRCATIVRDTRETRIRLELDLDGQGAHQIDTGVPFLDHMLTHVAAHGLFDLELVARGDIEVDDHHTVEDVAIVLGQALKQALGDRSGIVRYGSHILPMDEALVLVSLDLSGRGLSCFQMDFPSPKIGRFDTELVAEFMRALAHNGGITLHVRQMAGSNSHHLAEAAFKALGRALRQAVAVDPRQQGIPSTKGVL